MLFASGEGGGIKFEMWNCEGRRAHKGDSDGLKDTSELSNVSVAYVWHGIIADCKELKSNILTRSRSKGLTPEVFHLSNWMHN
jgi:hypothetical protein